MQKRGLEHALRPDRRTLLRAAGAAAVLLPWPRWARLQPRLQSDPFALGVASAPAGPHGVVLRTRLAGATDAAAVRWELADDAGFGRTVRRGTATALPALGHAVHVELEGLESDRWYHYRFLLGDAASATGRTRTAPAAASLPQRLRLVYASCQRWEHGHYAAWRHAAAAQPDLVLFLGDYLYEYAMPRLPVAGAPPPARSHALRHAVDLADYRDRYALHKSDPDLQAAHAAAPWLVTWDDHEVENDYAADRGRAADGQAAFLRQRSAAYQAFWENMPLPLSALAGGLAGIDPSGGLAGIDPAAAGPLALNLHRSLAWGRLARLHLLDARQHRDVQACRADGAYAAAIDPDSCAAWADPQRTLLGAAQERWLAGGLQQDAAAGGPAWSVLAQQTLLSPRHHRTAAGRRLVGNDAWDGYPAARQRLLDAVATHRAGRTLVLGGDIHQHVVAAVPASFDRPDAPAIAAELCGTSISSHSGTTPERTAALRAQNPHLRFADAAHRGFGLLDIAPGGCEARLMGIDHPAERDAAARVLAVVRIGAGADIAPSVTA